MFILYNFSIQLKQNLFLVYLALKIENMRKLHFPGYSFSFSNFCTCLHVLFYLLACIVVLACMYWFITHISFFCIIKCFTYKFVALHVLDYLPEQHEIYKQHKLWKVDLNKHQGALTTWTYPHITRLVWVSGHCLSIVRSQNQRTALWQE